MGILEKIKEIEFEASVGRLLSTIALDVSAKEALLAQLPPLPSRLCRRSATLLCLSCIADGSNSEEQGERLCACMLPLHHMCMRAGAARLPLLQQLRCDAVCKHVSITPR